MSLPNTNKKDTADSANKLPNTKQLLEDGIQSIMDAHAEGEVLKAGDLRGGNTGVLAEDGTYIGKCPSQTYLRWRQININPPDANRELMFQAGRLNEDGWFDYLTRGWNGEGKSILREEEIPTAWRTKQEIAVTGRPDIVYCQDDKPVLGLELKLVCSIWTARDVLLEGNPKFDHLAQAAHYSWQLGVPFELWYANRVDYAVPYPKIFPKLGEPGSEFLQYNDRGMALKIKPFSKGYSVKINELDGFVYYRDLHDERSKYVRTEISIDRIKAYYESIPDLTEVPKTPVNLKGDGSKANWTLDAYCPLSEKQLCCGQCPGKPIKEWEKEVKEATKDVN